SPMQSCAHFLFIRVGGVRRTVFQRAKLAGARRLVVVDLFVQRRQIAEEFHAVPTRRSSDLTGDRIPVVMASARTVTGPRPPAPRSKSTRLNSSHVSKSYAVFGLKKHRCAVPTGYGAAVHAAQIKTGDHCIVIGAGGVGVNAV